MSASKLEVLPPHEGLASDTEQLMLDQLMDFYGIGTGFIDCAGNCVEIPRAHRLRILEIMGIDTGDGAAVARAHRDLTHERYQQLLQPVYVVGENSEHSVALNIPGHALSSSYQWFISKSDESGILLSGGFCPDQLPESERIDSSAMGEERGGGISVRQLSLPPLAMGYYQLTVTHNNARASTRLIVAPSRCYTPEWDQQQRKLAGLSAQLYSLRSDRNWGVGDFSDLKYLIAEANANGMDFIILNPLHMLDASQPEDCSPYSPIDRCRLNPLYIDPSVEPDFIENEALQKQFYSGQFQRSLEKLRAPEFVNYTEATAVKYKVLAQMYSHFKRHHLKAGSDRAHAFQQFVDRENPDLEKFCSYQSQFSFGFTHAKDPQFHSYLQWLCEHQLEACQRLAVEQGMAIGLIRDLAIGSQRHSAEVALNPNLFCLNASIGAPPDPLAPQGQNWGLPPMKPRALKQSAYRHFSQLLKANMAHCSALRIDHVMGMLRQWWCPETNVTQLTNGDDHNHADNSCVQNRHGEGAYLTYPVDELFAVLRLESHLNQCVVIGEDLGIVPPEIHGYMNDSGLFSNALFYFEKYDSVHFKAPQDVDSRALTMIANHDVPTLAAWWNKTDLAMRSQINLIASDEEYQGVVHERESDLIQILHWLNNAGLLPESWQDFNIHKAFDTDLCRALLQANSRSVSQLVSLQLEDLCLAETPVNIPGTCNEYPNWRRKIPLSLTQIFQKPGDHGIESDSLSLISAFVRERS